MCAAVAKELDKTLGVASLEWDTDQDRRSLYGKAGAFRPKPFGLEYRVLSNAWCRNDQRVGYVYELVRQALKNLMYNRAGLNDGVEEIINSGDVTAARRYMLGTHTSWALVDARRRASCGEAPENVRG